MTLLTILLAACTVGAAFFLVFFFYSFLLPIVSGAPFVPTTKRTLDGMLRLAAIEPGEKAADLGAGDGRFVIAAAKAGAQAHGFEINPLLVWWGRRRIAKHNLTGKAFMHWQSLWKPDLKEFDVIFIYGLTNIMRPLKLKLKAEAKPEARVISNGFKFPDWPTNKKDNGAYLYLPKDML